MRGPRPTTGDAGSPRARLDRLDGLPLRPSTVLRLVDGDGDAPDLLDPGLALARLTGRPIPAVARDRWPDCRGTARDARRRLWRFAAAASLAAHRLATDADDPDADRTAGIALLQPLGLWAVAAAEPDLLGPLIDADPADARRLARSWFGVDLEGLGQRLARRWGVPEPLRDAFVSPGDLPADDRWSLIHRALRLAGRTPWALPGPGLGVAATDDTTRWLIARVQAATAAELDRLPGGDGPPDWPDRLVDSALARHDLEADLLLLGRRLESLEDAAAAGPRIEGTIGTRAALLGALAEFAAGAAHELNNPLAVIAGRAQLLQAKQEDPEDRRALQTIINQARRAHQMLRDLIYVARPPEPRSVPCVPDQVLRAAVDDLADEARRRGLRLDADLKRPAPAASADPDALRHLADVLIRNAIEATPEGGAVQVRSVGDESTLVWTVEDGGPGLDGAAAVHLLDPFYCGREAGRGLGLGLPRVTRFLDRAGGAIRWEPAPGGGTLVRVALPLRADGPTPIVAATSTPHLDRPAGPGRRPRPDRDD